MTRRDLLRLAGAAAAPVTYGCRLKKPKGSAAAQAGGEVESFTPGAALSLRALAGALRSGRDAAMLLDLGGLNRLVGASVEDDGDVLLLGHREAGWPSLHLDDLAVALRSAFRAGPEYQESPGCSIDPRQGVSDPWRIQKVRVFGMPFNCSMAARHVAVDYQLKKASLGLTVLPGVSSLMGPPLDPVSACRQSDSSPESVDKAHRFWFCPRSPDAPRFVQEGRAVWIEKPSGAQVLTEEEFLDKDARRSGSKPAEGEALAFSQAVSRLLAQGTLPDFVALRADFRLIEAAKLLALVASPAAALDYFLREHTLGAHDVPAFVGGLWREEASEITCENQVIAKPASGGISYEASARLRRQRRKAVGGVEARVRVAASDIRQARNELSPALSRVRQARPSPGAVIWEVGA